MCRWLEMTQPHTFNSCKTAAQSVVERTFHSGLGSSLPGAPAAWLWNYDSNRLLLPDEKFGLSGNETYWRVERNPISTQQRSPPGSFCWPHTASSGWLIKDAYPAPHGKITHWKYMLSTQIKQGYGTECFPSINYSLCGLTVFFPTT